MKTVSKKRIEVAADNKVYPSTVTRLISGDRKTYNIPLAIAVAQIAGKRPIDFINSKIKSLALEIHPSLGRKVKK